MTLDLFSADVPVELLPYDGEVKDYGMWCSRAQAQADFQYFLENLLWQPDEFNRFGQYVQTTRQVAWYGDAHFNYVYAGVSRIAHAWDARLWQLKQQLEHLLGVQFNSCLANLYHHGQEGMGWHQDNDMSLAKETVIASLSYGAERKFVFRHLATAEKREIWLQSGHLLVMQGTTQQNWQHALPKTSRVHTARINLTFRQFQR